MQLLRGELRLRAFWLATGLLLLAAIFVLAIVPMPTDLDLGNNYDKLLHSAAFSFLMVWFGGIVPRQHYWLLAITLLCYGGAIELAQSLLPYRYVELADLMANAVGVAVGWVLCLVGLRHWCDWLERLLARE